MQIAVAGQRLAPEQLVALWDDQDLSPAFKDQPLDGTVNAEGWHGSELPHGWFR